MHPNYKKVVLLHVTLLSTILFFGFGSVAFFKNDEFIKPATTQEILAKLRPAFKKEGSVTAGNSSGLNDGAIATIIASENAVKKYGLQPLAKIISIRKAV